MKKKKTKVLSIKDKMQKFEGDVLKGAYDVESLKRLDLHERTVRRKMRYWCFKLRHAAVEKRTREDLPKGLKKFVEGLPGFAGWENFAKTWDIVGGNPFMIVLRLQSVWDEWEHVMNRVAIPIDSPPEQINARLQALAEEYARNNK